MHETIAAIATPPGRGAIAIVRCSGPAARAIAARVFRAREPLRDRVATLGAVHDRNGALIDRGLALAMDAPRTVTGEDVVELHLHGSPLVARETLRALLDAGARLAGPGEFTRRAYLNGKLDLSAAEAVADLIEAESEAAARAAAANLSGGLRRAIDSLRARLGELLEELAGAIDYPDDVPEPARGDVAVRLIGIDDQLAALVEDWERGRLVREGVSLAIVGPPNAGKSSLLNALLEEDRAITSPIPGTTRDTIEERFVVDGIVVRAIDTAGLRTSADPLERLGVERARGALAAATLALVVIDGSRELDADARATLTETRARARIVLFNKRDLGTRGFDAREAAEAGALSGSAFDPATVRDVRAMLAVLAWSGATFDLSRPHLASARHADAVARGREALARARATVDAEAPLDLLVGDLVEASAALGEIGGAAVTEAAIDGVFARFCVGK
jgi:tRNA modification GTPase